MNKPARSNIMPMQQETKQAAAATARHTQRSKRKFKVRKVLLLGFTAWAAYVFFFVQSPNLNRLNEEQGQVHAELKQMEQTNQDIEQRITQLQDPQYIAEVARKKYMMVKEGDTLFVEPKQ